MPLINFELSAKIKKWFVQAIDAGKDFKEYLSSEEISPDSMLEVDQAITLIEKINRICALQMKVTRAILFAQKNPRIGYTEMQVGISQLCEALQTVEKQYCQVYEQKARETIKVYFHEKSQRKNPFAYDGIIKHDPVPTGRQMLQELAEGNPPTVDKRYLARIRWKTFISKTVHKKREHDAAWQKQYQTVQAFYKDVDNQVEINVRKHAHDEFKKLTLQHECFMKWITLFESAMAIAVKNTEKVYENFDTKINSNRKIGYLMLRVGVSSVLAPLMLKELFDTALILFSEITKKLEDSKGNVSLDGTEKQILWAITGLVPDPNSKTYVNAYRKMADETVYEKTARIKKYVQHKMDALNESASYADIMSSHTQIWGKYTPSQVIAAQRMKTIDEWQYDAPNHSTVSPENKNNLVQAVSGLFNQTVDEIFKPLQGQYGDSPTWQAIHKTIDKIQFNQHHAGEMSHNQHLDNSMLNALANQIEIYFIVKDLVENTHYLGGDQMGKRLHRGKIEFKGDDFSFGHHPDNTQTRSLVEILLKNIVKTDNEALKNLLRLNRKSADQIDLERHTLLSQDISARATVHTGRFGGIMSTLFGKPIPDQNHVKRQKMLTAIINTYYNQDLSVLLQEQLLSFGRSQGIDILQQQTHSYTLPQTNWMSDDEIIKLASEKTAPYIEEANARFEIRRHDGLLGMLYYQSNELTQKAKELRTADRVEDEAAKRRTPFSGNK